MYVWMRGSVCVRVVLLTCILYAYKPEMSGQYTGVMHKYIYPEQEQ